MRTKLAITLVATALTLAALAGCSSPGTSPTSGATVGSGGSAGTDDDYGRDYGKPAAPAPSGTASGLAVAETALGSIVVNAGKTVYVYDKDTQGATSSACTGACAANWPEVVADSTMPTGTGITGALGTITGVDGKLQLTLDGWPLYYFAGDAAAGDTSGQGVGGIWWVVAPDGTKLTQ